MRQLTDFLAAAERRWRVPVAALVLLAVAGLATTLVALAAAGAPTWLAAGLGGLLAAALTLLAHTLARQLAQSEQARQALARSHQSLEEAVNALPLGIAIYDPQDRLMLFNREAAEQVHYRDGGELIGQTFESLIRRSLARGRIPDALGREEAWLRERLEGRGRQDRLLLRQLDDGRWMHLYEIPTPSGGLLMARLDVTELVQKSEALERSNAQLERLSATDGLTGLANRRLFDQQLHQEWQRSMRTQLPLSLLLVDIDHFKRYNDHYGHVTGDACLRQVAVILSDCAQRAGELVARYGGEEFAVLLPGTDREAAMAVAQRCMDELAKARIEHANSTVSSHLTWSIGVATVLASPDLLPESLVRCADEALYRVKGSGRAQYSAAPCPA